MSEQIVHEERRNIHERDCPVDLMGELFHTKSKNEFLAFTLTAKAFMAMCAFPVKKEVVFFVPFGEKQSVGVQWADCEDYMVFETTDQCKTFRVINASTEEITYNSAIAESMEEITHYIIDVE